MFSVNHHKLFNYRRKVITWAPLKKITILWFMYLSINMDFSFKFFLSITIQWLTRQELCTILSPRALYNP